MAAYINEAANARDEMRRGRYPNVLVHVRAGLVRYRASGSTAERGIIANFVTVPAYGNLAAAYGASDIFDLMQQCAARAREVDEALKEDRFRWDDRIDAHRQTLTAMRWLQATVEGVGSLNLPDLVQQADIERVSKVKSRLAWMEKAGVVHMVGDIVRAGAASTLAGTAETVNLRSEGTNPDPGPMFLRRDLADERFLLRDFQGGFDLLIPDALPLDVYVTLADVIADPRLKVATVEQWLPRNQTLTDTLRSRKSEVDAALQALLDAAHESLGRSIVSDLWIRLVADRPEGLPGPPIADEFGGFISQAEIDSNLELFDRKLYDRPRRAFQDGLRHTQPIAWPDRFRATYWFHVIVRARLQALYRDAENIVRRQAGMAAVGEGWVSEVLLLRTLRDAFPGRQVQHQGRPGWLGAQSLDIYFPDEQIGVEFQGKQHSEPVARFGGVVAFERQLERDARKRELCRLNGCELIEVYPGYEIAEVVARVQVAIDRDTDRAR